jgi:hypothetical protein
MAEFKTSLDARCVDDKYWLLVSSLTYQSDLIGLVNVPAGFQTDFASVPRTPIAYSLFGDRAHHESVIHDYLYRKGSIPPVDRKAADSVFLEAMKCRGKGWFTRYAMYLGVRLGGAASYHKKEVAETIQ